MLFMNLAGPEWSSNLSWFSVPCLSPRTREPPSWSTQRHFGATSQQPAASGHTSLWLEPQDTCPNAHNYAIETHFITMRMATPSSESIIFVVIVNTIQSSSRYFFFLVACLRIRLRHVSLYKYWHESLRLFSIFLWKAQYGNVPSNPFTHLFWVLAPGSSYCSHQCLLVQWHFFPLGDRHGMFPFLKFSWEFLVLCSIYNCVSFSSSFLLAFFFFCQSFPS